MQLLRPASWEEVLAAKAEHPSAVLLAGRTDVIVEIDFAERLTGTGQRRLPQYQP